MNAATPGTTIIVRSGTYTEEIVIAKDLTLKGDGIGKTIMGLRGFVWVISSILDRRKHASKNLQSQVLFIA